MKYSGLTRLVLVIVIAIASYELSRGIINPFSYDLFDSCISATTAEPTTACEWGPQIMVNGLAGLFFFFIGILTLVRGTKLVTILPLAVMSVAYILVRLAFWRFDQQLNDNFAGLYQGAGPETFTEYLYLLYVSNSTVLMGLIIGGFYNIMEATNKLSVDESTRNAPRMIFEKAKLSFSRPSKSAPVKATKAKKAPAKATAKAKTASKAKKAPAKKKTTTKKTTTKKK